VCVCVKVIILDRSAKRVDPCRPCVIIQLMSITQPNCTILKFDISAVDSMIVRVVRDCRMYIDRAFNTPSYYYDHIYDQRTTGDEFAENDFFAFFVLLGEDCKSIMCADRNDDPEYITIYIYSWARGLEDASYVSRNLKLHDVYIIHLFVQSTLLRFSTPSSFLPLKTRTPTHTTTRFRGTLKR